MERQDYTSIGSGDGGQQRRPSGHCGRIAVLGPVDRGEQKAAWRQRDPESLGDGLQDGRVAHLL